MSSISKNQFIAFSLIVFLGVFILLNQFVKMNLSIRTVSQVFPKEKWILVSGRNDQLISSVIDYVNGHVVQYDINQFERGEFVSLKLLFETGRKKYFNKGDSILSIISSNVEEKLSQLSGEFEIAKSNLIVYTSGQKKALIEEIKNKINYTQEKN